MSERWLIIGTNAPRDELANFGVGCDRRLESPLVPRGMGYVVDPDKVVVTDLKSGERRTLRDLFDEPS